MKPESLVIAGQPYGGESVPESLLHTRPSQYGAGHASRYLTARRGMPKARASDWSDSRNKGETNACWVFGWTLLHTQKEGSYSELTWALSHMDSSMCSSAPDPEMWIIQGTLAWRTPPVRTGLKSNGMCLLYLYLDSKWESSYFTMTCHGKEEGGEQAHLRERSTPGELYLRSGRMIRLRKMESIDSLPIGWTIGCDGFTSRRSVSGSSPGMGPSCARGK
ncbi:hypothetical protein Tco_0978086 [Tanacetum coccineum]|uniref:Uncharacterized protein n=1 Tax=Tanacetum coccineum TaxID=301880 RepID=A0ABQ5EM70_9ASTR